MARSSRVVALPEFWILTALSTVLHFWRLFTPDAVVFDEAHYERFAGYYLTGSYFFDVHPPLGRLIFTGFASALGITPATLALPAAAPLLRLLPAAFGTLLVPLVFLLLRQVGASRRVATLGALAVLFDNGLLAMSRFILPDIFLIVFGLGAVCLYLAARTREGKTRLAFLAASALLGGCALSVKWTGASGLGVVLAAWFVESVRGRAPVSRLLREGALLVSIPALVYVAAWGAHFALLSHSGPGNAFMSRRFQAQLSGTPHYDPAAPRLSLRAKLADVHHAIRYGNGQLETVAHPGSSPWHTWPIMKHPINLWESAARGDGSRAMILLLGNPVVWWGAIAGALLGLAGFIRRRQRFAGVEYGFLLLLGGALLNYLPFIAITRVMYLYHYLFALVFLVALGALSSGVLAGWNDSDDAPWRFPSRRSALAYAGIVALMVVGFVYFLPFTYGWTLSAASRDAHFWVLHPTF